MGERVTLHHGDCLAVLPRLAAEGVKFDAACTDPPYHLASIVRRFGKAGSAPAKSDGASGVYARASKGFMGEAWDGGDIAFRPETWKAVLDVLKPGAHLVAFGGSRTHHRLASAIEDAGFEILDMLAWLYGSGFAKSHDFGASHDRRLLGIDRDEDPKDWEASRSHFSAVWEGWGSALKPALEPITLARKPLDGSIYANVLLHGCGGLNIDACRVAAGARPLVESRAAAAMNVFGNGLNGSRMAGTTTLGRWPANVVHDGSAEVERSFSVFEAPGQRRPADPNASRSAQATVFDKSLGGGSGQPRGDAGSPSRFFYSSKADADDRIGSRHPTVKPVDLMRWLVRLVTPPGGLVLDPFAGTGTTGVAALREGMRAVLIEREDRWVADIRKRLAMLEGADTPLFAGAAE